MLSKHQKDYIHGLIRNLPRLIEADFLRAAYNDLETISNIIKADLDRGDTREHWQIPMSERNSNFSKAHFQRFTASFRKKAKKWKF
jgi:hypothetical protein